MVDDAAMFPPGNAEAGTAVREHLGYRSAWFAPVIGPLVVPDSELAGVGRLVPPGTTIAVSVINSGGAGGLISLARRTLPGLQVVAVESALRDLDDLATNAARVAAAAAELETSVTVYVELPYAPGWERAVEVVEANGLKGKIRTGGVDAASYPSRTQLAEQLSVLVEADLPFKATAGLHRAWPTRAGSPGGDTLPQHGFLSLLVALAALIDGAAAIDAADLLAAERPELAAAVAGWDDATTTRVRRRFRSFGCCGVTDPIDDLVALGLLTVPT